MVLAMLAPAHAGVTGEGASKEIHATRTPRPPRIDGDLDDEVWTTAVADDRFTQRFPDSGAAPTQRTTIKILYDDRALYLGITAYDLEPDKIVARLSRRDRTVLSDEINIYIDTRHDHDNGYWLWINAAGVLADGQLHDDTRTNRNWDAVWQGKAKIGDFGWSAEIAIPYAIMRFPRRQLQRWGFNVLRAVGRTKETMQWTFVPRTEEGTLSRAGHITGISNIDPPRALELRPFTVLRGESLLERGGLLGLGHDAELDGGVSIGVDLKYAVTNDLTLDLAVLPDFGQVEADPVVLNLSTYETHFPEKRPFFLENANLFVTDIGLFYSRRIGGRSSGLAEGDDVTADYGGDCAPACTVAVARAPVAVPIWAAARLTGKLSSNFTLATLTALTGAEDVDLTTSLGGAPAESSSITPTPARNFTAARGKYSLGGSSYLGFIATSRLHTGAVANPADDHDAITESIDGRWVAADSAYRLYFQLAASHRLGGPTYVDGDDATCTDESCTPPSRADGTLLRPGTSGIAGELGGGKRGGKHWLTWNRYEFSSPGFDVNDVGFESDWDYHKLSTTLTYREQQRFWRLQEASTALTLDAGTGWQGLLKNLSLRWHAAWLYRNFWSQSVQVNFRPSRAWNARETSDGARYERTRYAWLDLKLGTDTRNDLSGGLSSSIGGSLVDGSWFLGAHANIDLRVVAPLELSLAAAFDMSENALRFYSCSDPVRGSCSILSRRRDYIFSELDSGSLSLTMRGTLALSPELSVQAYAQLFAARGRYGDYRAASAQLGAHPFLYRSELEAVDFRGDNDGDGIKDDDFASSTLNANLVVRWEFAPGATLMGVYTRAQAASVDVAGDRPVIGFRGLARGRTEEIVLAKLTWFWRR